MWFPDEATVSYTVLLLKPRAVQNCFIEARSDSTEGSYFAATDRCIVLSIAATVRVPSQSRKVWQLQPDA